MKPPTRRPGSLVLALLLLAAAGAAAPVTEGPVARRLAVLQAMEPGDLLIVRSGTTVPGGLTSFLPSKNFLYLMGLAQEDQTLVLRRGGDGSTQEVLFLPEPNLARARWEGHRLVPGEEAARITGVEDIRANTGLPDFLDLYQPRARRVFHNLPEGERKRLPSGPETRVSRLTAPLRMVKSAAEIQAIQKAVDVTGLALQKAFRVVEPGRWEYQVQAVIEATMRWQGAQGLAFPSIIGSGPNSTVLHYRSNRDRLDAGEMVVMDVGAELDGYAADVTRTVPVSGRFTPRQREVYEVVLRAQAAAIAAVRPGVTLKDVDAAARKVIVTAGFGDHFLHSTSHWVGLDVHDPGVPRATLQPGMVLTVEPGIYIPDESLGVRIEDDVVVTEDGCRVLSADIPRSADEIEAALAR